MSEQARAADWWQASDGKWYPPTSLPPAPPPPPRPPRSNADARWASPPRLSGALSAWVQGLMWLSGAVWAVAMLAEVVAMQRFDDWWNASRAADDAAWSAWESAEETLGAIGSIGSVVGVALFIVMIVWTRQAHEVSAWLNPQRRRWTSGWAIGGWFIPLANFVIPKLVLHEIERLALAAREPAFEGRDWRKLPTLPVGWVWWLGTIVAVTVGVIAELRLNAQFNSVFADREAVRSGYGWSAASSAMLSGSLVAGGFYVRAVTRRIADAADRR